VEEDADGQLQAEEAPICAGKLVVSAWHRATKE
jgi:hypothetical protein